MLEIAEDRDLAYQWFRGNSKIIMANRQKTHKIADMLLQLVTPGGMLYMSYRQRKRMFADMINGGENNQLP